MRRETGDPYRSRVGKPAGPLDFVVTTPRARMREAAAEAADAAAADAFGDGPGYYARSVPFIPRGCVPGSRIFYVEDFYVRGFGVADRAIGRDDPAGAMGPWIRIPCDSWKWIRPIPMKGFRGIRRFDAAVEVVGGWLDPRPEA